MYAAIKGIYDKGQIILQEEVPAYSKAEVIVIFSENESNTIPVLKERKPGGLEGKVTIPDDFNKINVFM